MKIDDLLLELKNQEKPKYDIEHYGNYIVTMSKSPVKVPSITGDKEMFVARVQHKKNKQNVQLGAGNSQGEARDAAFAKVHATDRPEDPDAFKQFTIDLNAPFTREYSDPRSGHYYKITKLGNTPVLVMASRQYFAAFGKDMESLGFRKAAIGRTSPTAGAGAAEMYNFNISKNQIKALNLIPNMRYSLEEVEPDSDGNRMFKMIPDTRTAGKNDKYRMPGPGLTVAASMKESLEEGYVKRNGAAFSFRGLRLHFYRDHVFYVVQGGPNISIYKDGVPTPRNDEIYVKDAAAHGVPKDIITIISTWLNTPLDKQEALLPRIEAAMNHIIDEWLKQSAAKKEDVDEALLSPRVHEIFLKGLVGAILSGGFSLGLDYAKEKTADLDRQGLQAVYKSIDPREYPELTKKLTPKDKKGLDAILGKLKEHAMRMEDIISEEEKTMSRAGKGVMKYGKDGMKALAKAGRDGASDEKLDKLRDKYNKYDEGTEPDHEASMAKGQLYNAAKNAVALMKMIEDGDNLEGWVASKISRAADYLNSVHDYMAYEEVSEGKQKGVDGKACWKGYKRMGTKQKGGKTVDNCVKIKK